MSAYRYCNAGSLCCGPGAGGVLAITTAPIASTSSWLFVFSNAYIEPVWQKHANAEALETSTGIAWAGVTINRQNHVAAVLLETNAGNEDDMRPMRVYDDDGTLLWEAKMFDEAGSACAVYNVGQLHDGYIVSWTADGNVLATSRHDANVTLYDGDDGTVLGHYTFGGTRCRSVATHPDDPDIAYFSGEAADGARIERVNLDTGAVVAYWEDPDDRDGFITQLAIAPDPETVWAVWLFDTGVGFLQASIRRFVEDGVGGYDNNFGVPSNALNARLGLHVFEDGDVYTYFDLASSQFAGRRSAGTGTDPEDFDWQLFLPDESPLEELGFACAMRGLPRGFLTHQNEDVVYLVNTDNGATIDVGEGGIGVPQIWPRAIPDVDPPAFAWGHMDAWPGRNAAW